MRKSSSVPIVVIALAALAAARGARADAPASGPEAQLYSRLCVQVVASYDSAKGGWVRGGRPSTSSVALGFAQVRDGGPPMWRAFALRTVDWTWTLYDSVGGGFLETAADARHDVPTFDKRTDSNSARLENLVEAWRLTNDETLHRRSAAVADFFLRVLADGRGGFVDGQVGDRELVPRSNGMAIHAYLVWAVASAEPHVRDFVMQSLDRSWKHCWNDTLGMVRHNELGEISAAPQLADQTEMGRAYVLGSHIDSRDSDLQHAVAIGELIERNYVDPKRGTWRTQAMPDKSGKIKSAGSDPAENARAALFFAELAAVTGDSKWRDVARRGILAWSDNVDHAGEAAGDWALAVRALSGADLPAPPEWKADVIQHTPTSKSYGRHR